MGAVTWVGHLGIPSSDAHGCGWVTTRDLKATWPALPSKSAGCPGVFVVIRNKPSLLLGPGEVLPWRLLLNMTLWQCHTGGVGLSDPWDAVNAQQAAVLRHREGTQAWTTFRPFVWEIAGQSQHVTLWRNFLRPRTSQHQVRTNLNGRYFQKIAEFGDLHSVFFGYFIYIYIYM